MGVFSRAYTTRIFKTAVYYDARRLSPTPAGVGCHNVWSMWFVDMGGCRYHINYVHPTPLVLKVNAVFIKV